MSGCTAAAAERAPCRRAALHPAGAPAASTTPATPLLLTLLLGGRRLGLGGLGPGHIVCRSQVRPNCSTSRSATLPGCTGMADARLASELANEQDALQNLGTARVFQARRVMGQGCQKAVWGADRGHVGRREPRWRRRARRRCRALMAPATTCKPAHRGIGCFYIVLGCRQGRFRPSHSGGSDGNAQRSSGVPGGPAALQHGPGSHR